MELTKIIVCDDIREDREKLVRDIREIWTEAEVEEAADGQEVLWKLEKDRDYEFVFLDIFMDGMSGIDTGRKIREYYPEIKLVFVSSSREFGPEAFELNAQHYLLKPYKKELLKEIHDRYSRKADSKIVIYDSSGKQKQEIISQRVSYIESAHNYVYIHLITGAELKARSSLHELEAKLDERFLRINRGVIVNMEEVEKMNSDSCEIDGVTFMLSRRQRAECRRKYNNYIFRHYMGED